MMMESKILALKESIELNSKRLIENDVDGNPITHRTKKRILQNLGKLNKELNELLEEKSIKESNSKVTNKRRIDMISLDKNNDRLNELEDDVDTNDSNLDTNNNKTLLYNKEERKLKLRYLNKELAEYSQKKQLKLAIKRFEWGIRKGLRLDIHSYTNLLNAYVRCNDLDGAEAMLIRIKNNKDIQPNLITYTTLLKGYGEVGNIHKVVEIYFHVLKTENLIPNVRTFNTLLRSCVRVGMKAPALQAYFEYITLSSSSSTNNNNNALVNITNNNNVTNQCGDMNASTFEYLIGLLCRSGSINEVELILAQFIEYNSNQTTTNHTSNNSNNKSTISAGGVTSALDNSAVYIQLSSIYMLLG